MSGEGMDPLEQFLRFGNPEDQTPQGETSEDAPYDEPAPGEMYDTLAEESSAVDAETPQIQGGEHRDLDNAVQIEGGEYYTEDDRLLAGGDRRGNLPLPTVTPEIRQAWHDRIDEELDKVNDGEVNSVRFSSWEANVGGGDIQTLHAVKMMLSSQGMPRKDPEWPLVQRPVPRFRPIPSRTAKPVSKQRSLKQAVILPDTQIPYHDPAATAIALQATYDMQPDQIVLVGDYLDLAEQSRWPKEPEYARTTQLQIDIGHRILEMLREGCPDSRIILIEGNHDKRLPDHIKANAEASYGLRRANSPPETWPVMSIPYLLYLEELDIEYVSGYPNNKHWINPRLKVVHGDKTRSGGSTAGMMDRFSRHSVIFGHIHRIETHYMSVEDYDGDREVKVDKFAHTPGCLCLVDGSVPDGRNGKDYRTDEVVPKVNNWQQGFSSILYDKEGEMVPVVQAYQIVTRYDGKGKNKKLKYLAPVGDSIYTPDKTIVQEISPENFESAYTGTFERKPTNVRRIATA